jgi:hypothetical protein
MTEKENAKTNNNHRDKKNKEEKKGAYHVRIIIM